MMEAATMEEEQAQKQAPNTSASDSLDLTRPARRLKGSPAGQLLEQFLFASGQAGEEAEQAYREALEKLRGRAEEVLVEVARAEAASEEEDYPARWALTHAAAELRHPAALAFLKNLVLTPIPPERRQDPHASSTAEEMILRTTAIDGIGYLAAEGDEKALETLFEVLQLPWISTRRAAVQAILGSPEGSELRERLEELLPAEHRFLLDLKRVHASDVPQISHPERQLKEEARKREEKAAMPRLPGESPKGLKRGGRRGSGPRLKD
jgi:hypothetical protein